MRVAKMPIYPVKCPFPLFIALRDHKPQRYRQSDVMHLVEA